MILDTILNMFKAQKENSVYIGEYKGLKIYMPKVFYEGGFMGRLHLVSEKDGKIRIIRDPKRIKEIVDYFDL